MSIVIPVGLDTDALDRQLSSLEDKAQSAGKAVGDSFSKGAKKAEKSADDAAKGLEDLGDAAGLPVDKLKKLAGGFAALGNPATAAVVAVGAFAVGIGLAVTGIVAAVSASKELADALKPLSKQEGFGISKSQLVSIQSANDAMGALGAILKQVVLRLGAEFAPAVERVATLLVKFGLMALDAFNTFASGHDVLREFAVFLVNGLISAMTGVVTSLMNVLEAMADVARAAGQDGLAGKLEGVTQRWSAFKAELAEDVVSALGESFVKAEQATGDYDARAKALIGSMKLLGQSTKDTAGALDAYSAGLFKALDLTKEIELLVAEGALAPGTKDIRNASEEYKRIAGTVKDIGWSVEKRALFEADIAVALSRGEITLEEAARLEKERAAAAHEYADAVNSANQERALNAIGAVQGGLEGIVALIAGPVAGAIAGLILNLEETVSGLIDQLKSLPNIIKAIPKLAVKLVEAVVDLIPKLAAAIPKLIDGIIAAVPKIVIALVTGLIDAIPSLIVTTVKLIVTYLVASSGVLALQIISAIVSGLWRAFEKFWADFSSGELIDGLKQAALESAVLFLVHVSEGVKDALASIKTIFTVDFWKDVLRGLKAALKELLSLGAEETKIFGDAPSMQRAGPQGANVRTSPGDYFLAGRNPQALLEQALNGVFGAGAATPAMAGGGGGQVNMAWQHRAFDGFFVRHAQLGGQTTSLFQQMKASKDARGM